MNNYATNNPNKLLKLVHLHKLFPQSKSYIIQRTIFWLLSVPLLLAAYVNLFRRELYLNASSFLLSDTTYLFLAFLGSLLLVLGAKVIYLSLLLSRFSYTLRGSTLECSKGVFWKDVTSISINKISGVELQRNFIDVLLGLHRLVIMTPAEGAKIVIPGLSESSAKGLLSFIEGLEQVYVGYANEAYRIAA